MRPADGGARDGRDRGARLPAQRPRALAAPGRADATLGLVIEDVANPFYSAIAQAVEKAARERGCMLITASCEEDPERERELVLRAAAPPGRRAAARPRRPRPPLPAARDAAGTPVVFVDRPPQGIEADTRPARQRRRRARRGRAPARARPRRIAYVARPPRALHRRRAPRRLPRGAARRRAPVDDGLVRLGTHDADEAEAVGARAARAARRTGARPRSSPPTTATRSARCARCATATGSRARRLRRLRARRPAPGPSPSSATTPAELGRRPPRWPSRASTATTGRRSGASCRRRRRGPRLRGAARAVKPTAVLPPNPLRHFYRGGAGDRRAARHRPRRRPHRPRSGSARSTRSFGEAERGLSRLRGRRRSSATRSPPTPRAASAPSTSPATAPTRRCWSSCSTPASACPVHFHPDRAFAREHLGCDHGKTEAWLIVEAEPGAEVARRLRARTSTPTRSRGWVDDAGHRRDARRAAPAARQRRATPSSSPPARPHAIGAGILMVELQEPTDFSILLEWDGFGIDRRAGRHLGLGWDVALAASSAPPGTRRPLRGPRRDGAVAELLPAAAAPYFRAGARCTGRRPLELPAGFAILVVIDGRGTLGRPRRRAAATRCSCPHAAGATASSRRRAPSVAAPADRRPTRRRAP